MIERCTRRSRELNAAGQYAYYGRVGGCLITGNEDGIKHCAMNILYSLQHLGYTIPPQADAGWIGEAGPGPSYLDPGSGGPENDFTNRNTTFMTWNLMHLARDAQGRRRHPRPRQPALRVGRRLSLRLREPRVPAPSQVPTRANTVTSRSWEAAMLLRQREAHRQARAERRRRVARVHAAGELQRQAQAQAEPAVGAGSADARGPGR